MTIIDLLRAGRRHNASDIHIVVGMPPLFRVDGEIMPAKGQPITSEAANSLAFECLNDDQKARLQRDWQLCFSTAFGERDRARVTVYYRNGLPELSLRLSEPEIRTPRGTTTPANCRRVGASPQWTHPHNRANRRWKDHDVSLSHRPKSTMNAARRSSQSRTRWSIRMCRNARLLCSRKC